MFNVKDRLKTTGITHYYKRRSLGSGFVRFASGKIYYLPKFLAPITPNEVITLAYIVRRDGVTIRSISRVFTDEESFKASLTTLCKILLTEPKHTFRFRGSRHDADFKIKEVEQLLTGFSSGKEMLSWVKRQTDLDEVFEEDVIDGILKLY